MAQRPYSDARESVANLAGHVQDSHLLHADEIAGAFAGFAPEICRFNGGKEAIAVARRGIACPERFG